MADEVNKNGAEKEESKLEYVDSIDDLIYSLEILQKNKLIL